MAAPRVLAGSPTPDRDRSGVAHGMLCTVSEYPGEPQRHDDDQAQRQAQAGAPNPSGPPPMGWYPDPADARLERYWDGAQWTRNTRLPPTAPPAGAAAQNPAVQGPPAQNPAVQNPATPANPGSYGQYGPRGNAPQPMPYRTQAGFAPSGRPSTADGVRLAGWWARFAALFVDYLILSVVHTLAVAIFAPRIVTAVQAWESDLMAAVSSGSTDIPTSPVDPRYGITTLWAVYSAAMLIVQFLYATLLMHYKGATLGQLALGLRVVPTGRGRDRFGLGWSTSVIRNAAWLVSQAFSLIPALSTLGGLLTIVNGAWPLFNRRRQALHDLLGRTQVISTRP